MTSRVNTAEIDERLVVASVRKDRTVVREIEPPPLVPLSAETTPLPEVVVVEPIKEEIIVSTPAPELPKDEGRRKRNKQDYEALFIKEVHITARLGKTVYIRKEFHDRIMKIVQVIGENEVSLFSYIDNIISHHFDTYQDDIVKLYERKNSNSIF